MKRKPRKPLEPGFDWDELQQAIGIGVDTQAPLVPLIRCTTTPPCQWKPGCYYCQQHAKGKR